MNNFIEQPKTTKIQALEMAKEYIMNGQDIPIDFARILFPPEKREYELTYYGKESKEYILSNTIAVPLQEDKIFPPNAKIMPNEWANKLIFGENMQILKTLLQMKKDGKLKNPDGKDGIKLIYIDPPFATKHEFKASGEDQVAYSDKLAGSEFIEFIRKRLIISKELLTDDGVIFVHLDQKMSHYIKIIMDEVFGKNYFLNEIIWGYRTGGASQKKLSQKHDNILLYSKTHNYNISTFKERQYLEKPFMDSKIDSKGRYYTDTLARDIIEGLINVVRDEKKEIIETVNTRAVLNLSSERTGYPTQKPEGLVEIILELASKKGDIILDFFAGSGTTPVVAEKIERKWIAVDIGKYSIYTIQKRLLQLGNIKPFILYSGGLYDAEKLNKFDNENWKLFALQLWNCKPEKIVVKGFQFDGEKDNCLVKVFSPQELEAKKSNISIETINDIDSIIGKNAGNEIFVIAPQGKFTFAEDEIEIKGRIYHVLRVPYSMLAKFTESFTAPTQPKDSVSINEIVDSVGFDFVQPPNVEFEINDNNLQIKNFKSNSRIKGERTTELSMLLIDYTYNGEVFNIDDVFYNKDLYEKDKSTKLNVLKQKILIKAIKDTAMFIFIDNAGNERKVIVNGSK